MAVPASPKIYHIVHVDRLNSIISTGGLLSDKGVTASQCCGTNIGLNNIKHRRLTQNKLASHPGLYVGECVPFYFCPRSVMLFVIHKGDNPDLTYNGGQRDVVHLQADLNNVVKWASQNNVRWAFTDSNAGSYYYRDFSDLSKLGNIDWNAVDALQWKTCREGKQAEFLIENFFPLTFVEYVGVQNKSVHMEVSSIFGSSAFKPVVQVRTDWYY